jgi:hypothetical protein
MRFVQLWYHAFISSVEYDPPGFVEYLMVTFTVALGVRWLLGLCGMLTDGWPYLVLSSSFAIGAALSMWVREILAPSPRSRVPLVISIALLIFYSAYAFADFARNYL